MEIKENKIEVRRTGVYYQSMQNVNADVKWFACHGYGQVANNLIRKFDSFVKLGHTVISVEALNRFYWQGVTGDAVTTWMTKRFREDEIKDNNAYLSQVYNDTLHLDGKRILFGFSQGGTTIWRWIFDKRPDFDVFINYAGWMPEDIDLSILKEYLADKKLVFTYGMQDEYLTDERIKALHEVIEKSKLNILIHRMDGVHKVDRSVLKDIYNKYIM